MVKHRAVCARYYEIDPEKAFNIYMDGGITLLKFQIGSEKHQTLIKSRDSKKKYRTRD